MSYHIIIVGLNGVTAAGLAYATWLLLRRYAKTPNQVVARVLLAVTVSGTLFGIFNGVEWAGIDSAFFDWLGEAASLVGWAAFAYLTYLFLRRPNH